MTTRNQALTGVSPRAMFNQPFGQMAVLRVNYAPDDDSGQAPAAEAVAEDTAAAPVAEDTAPAQAAEGQGPAPELDAEAEPGPEAAPEGETEAQAKERKRQSLQDRNKELTWRLRETERREQALLDRLSTSPSPTPATAPQADPDAEPVPSEYVYGEADAAYIKDLARYEVRQELKVHAAKTSQQTEADRINSSHAERQAAFAALTPDFDEVVIEGGKDGKWPCTQQMVDAIKTSEVGPEVAYHLAKHPDEARRIAALPPTSQVRELDRLAGRIEARRDPAPTPTPTPKIATDAPEPAPQARGSAGRFAVPADTNDFPAFEQRVFNPSRAPAG